MSAKAHTAANPPSMANLILPRRRAPQRSGARQLPQGFAYPHDTAMRRLEIRVQVTILAPIT